VPAGDARRNGALTTRHAPTSSKQGCRVRLGNPAMRVADVDREMWIGRCGSGDVDREMWIGRCRSGDVDREMWIGRCGSGEDSGDVDRRMWMRRCESADAVWRMWFGGCGSADVVRRMWFGGCGSADVVGGCGRRMWFGGCGSADLRMQLGRSRSGRPHARVLTVPDGEETRTMVRRRAQILHPPMFQRGTWGRRRAGSG
jgi:hypothetical protein